ncbi:MAG: AMP-binding protein, partial [Caulobacterales bacterium]|nr:AMP-binding protein [Caulobacterales bacterium]
SKLVMPGKDLDGASVQRLIVEEGITHAAAVPTVWTMLLTHLEQTGDGLGALKEVTIGGSAVPRSMIQTFDERYGVRVIHAWGMTEMSPLGTVNRPVRALKGLSPEEMLDLKCKQGRPCFGVELKIVDDAGQELPRDGVAAGNLLVRGPWIAERYFGREDESLVDAEGWFDTGDVATIDRHGFMQITDRAKDLIKSGGEWISSVDLENAAAGSAIVEMACAIGVPHPRWDERPLLLVKARDGATPDAAAVVDHLAKTFAKWQLPDDVVFVDELPLTATGKLDKKVLRAKYERHLMDRA